MDRTAKTTNVFFGYEEIRSPRVKEWEGQQNDAYHDYRKKWEENPKSFITPDFPLHMDMESSSHCNLLCPMCGRTIHKSSWRPKRHMDLEVFKKCIDEGASKGLCALNLNNVGEPLMNPSIVDMVRHAKDSGLLDVFFHTNGTLLTKEMSLALIDAGLDRIIISVDSPYKERYESIRVGAKFEEVIQNIKDLHAARKELNSNNPLTRLNVIRFPELTESEVEDLEDLLGDYVDIIGFLEFQEYDEKKMEKPFYPEGYASSFICPMLFSRLSVFEDGDVVPCCVEMSGKLRLGNVFNETLEEIWKGDKLAKLREIHLAGRFYEVPACGACDWAVKQDLKLAKKVA